MAYRICKSFEIENGHMLSKHPDLCKFPHGHTRKVEFILEAGELDANEMVCDFKILKEAMEDYLATLDHALCMNTDDPKFEDFKQAYGDRVIGFPSQDPTTEVMAKVIHEKLAGKLREFGWELLIPANGLGFYQEKFYFDFSPTVFTAITR